MNKVIQLFKDYVKEVKQLNEFKIREIDSSIDEILENPQKFGENFVENNLSRTFKKILKAKGLGVDFAKKNIAS